MIQNFDYFEEDENKHEQTQRYKNEIKVNQMVIIPKLNISEMNQRT